MKGPLTLETLPMWLEAHPSWWPVRMLPGEGDEIAELGRSRNENGKRRGWRSKTQSQDDRWHVVGLAGEWAVGLAFNLRIGCITSSSAEHLNTVGDVGGFIEVRTAAQPWPDRWDLGSTIPALKPDRAYVHCIGALFPEWVVITGWAWGREIGASTKTRTVEYQPAPVHFLEQRHLRPPKALFAEVRERANPRLI